VNNPVDTLLALLDGKVFPLTVGISPKTAEEYLCYLKARLAKMRPITPELNSASKEALGYGAKRLAPLQLEALEAGYRLVFATDEDLGTVLYRATVAATKAGHEPPIGILDFSHLASKTYVMNQDWVQLFAWMVPALDRSLTQESHALARKMFMALYLELRGKSAKSDVETIPMLALQKMLGLEPPTLQTNNDMTRHDFETGVGTRLGTPLRNLAKDISQYPCSSTRQAGFFSAAPPPYNYLANGETANYTPIGPVACPLQIAHWKFPDANAINCCLDRGFNDDSAKLSWLGMSLLFDPLVDAGLAANANCVKSPVAMPQSDSTVIVLSDYGAAYDPDINLVGFSGKDWGEEEAYKVLYPPMPGGHINKKQVSRTLVNLWDCICGGSQWQTAGGVIEKAIHKQKILVWNFMPFLRGGGDSMEDGAIPLGACVGWIQTCLKWLGDFVHHVNPAQVVWCTQFPIRVKALAQIGVTCSSQKAGPPTAMTAKLGGKSRHVHLLHHPCTWKGPSSPHWQYFEHLVTTRGTNAADA
jgi:hypothetical protein